VLARLRDVVDDQDPDAIAHGDGGNLASAGWLVGVSEPARVPG
jgi:hypothetical protein